MPGSLIRTWVLAKLPPDVEGPRVELSGGRLVISGKVRRLGLRIPFRLELAPEEVVWQPGRRQLVFRVARFRPLDTDWMVNYALKDLKGMAGVEYQDRRLGLDLEGMLEGLPGWKSLPEPLKQVVKLKGVRIPEEGGRLILELGP